jgi:hypothetical protein
MKTMAMVQKYCCTPAIGKTTAMSANRMEEKTRIRFPKAYTPD